MSPTAIMNVDVNRFLQGGKSTLFAKAPAGVIYGASGFSKSGIDKRWVTPAPRVASLDPKGDGKMTTELPTGFLRPSQRSTFINMTISPPFGDETRTQAGGSVAKTSVGNHPGRNPFPIIPDPKTAPFVPFGRSERQPRLKNTSVNS